MIHYPKHVGDWMKDTAHLSMLEEAAYGRLVDQYYTRERPLPVEPQELYRLARAKLKAERAAVDYVVATFFRVAADGLHQKRCDAEVLAYQDRAAKARRSAELRWKRPRCVSAAADDMRMHCGGNASHKPIAINQKYMLGGGDGVESIPRANPATTTTPTLSAMAPEPDTLAPAALPDPLDKPAPPDPVATPGQAAAGAAFAMHEHWQPEPDFAARLLRAGAAPLTPPLLAEFVSYRLSTGTRCTQTEWEHKLLQRLQHLRPAERAVLESIARAAADDPLSAAHSPAERVRAAAARAGFARREADHD